MTNTLKIATRESPLAMWQANFVKASLQKLHPHLHIELLPLKTSGDKFLKDRLKQLGSKGLFVKELEEALLSKQADIAVHSMKDVPSKLPNGLIIASICKRDNPFDALVSMQGYTTETLPQNAKIGTSSFRRQAQLLRQFPNIAIDVLRGNIHTRIDKLKAGEFDAIILAKAGLDRMNIDISHHEITKSIMLPACAQGALGIECREDDDITRRLISPLNHEKTAICVNAERYVNQQLGGNCHVPVAIFAEFDDQDFRIDASVFSTDGRQTFTAMKSGTNKSPNEYANQVAESLIQQGALALIEKSLHEDK